MVHRVTSRLPLAGVSTAVMHRMRWLPGRRMFRKADPFMSRITALVAAITLAMLATPVLGLAGAATARAETRIFLIDNSEGYGVDGCLASGAPCGERIAAAWCRSHAYTSAIDFGRVDGEFTASVRAASTAPACTGAACPTVVAITCSR